MSITFTLRSGGLTDEQLILELSWAHEELAVLHDRLFHAEYQSSEWWDALHDVPFIKRRLVRLTRALYGETAQ